MAIATMAIINSKVFLVMPRSLEWNVVFGLALFEPPPIGLDEFQGIGDQLE